MNEVGKIFEASQQITSVFSNVATIMGVILIVIAVIEFKNNRKKVFREGEQLLVQNSINVLKTFNESILPQIEEVKKTYTSNFKLIRKTNENKIDSGQRLEMSPNISKNQQTLEKKMIWLAKNKSGYGHSLTRLNAFQSI
ncbi:hypothetical protein [Secundilactobacillus paracollinoides]|uniref:Uncharacterized protein n=1 Tax=Secundilactobacillus paracollinoides TaxID=240427 RepID=A0A1B2IY51_9LACO|nr:hypothetical protein [Secundilactobacillus paracollinoides]ANZ61082.1 hypothetical protein AYR61_06815 [Secundilactobacillus paracollinoides]ANZ67004.1 hypothetical protein AYR63_07570 [Secundilactobacillus paracollinoides]KRL79393.1 hypothetical protein FC17_GL000501 [Secundilactobacillus paracollinoides DSM 15502 = JCM 11969]